VNGERVQGSHRLAPADVIRLGTEEFRFHADVLPAEPAPAVNAESADAEEAPPAVSRPAEPAAIVTQTDERPVLATLEVINEGPARGSRYFIRTSVAQVGRGAHNDVRLPDESVSETHARLQRRDDGWYAVDLDSTNGTYVGGSRVTTERLLNDAPDVRFGGVKLRFLPSQPSSGDTVPSSSGGDSAAADRRRLASSMAQPASDPEGVGAPTTRWLLVLLALATTVATFFVLKGRS
jgi:pSer/pThr/pTyr-binding forkhead associated (FHA) protein